MTTDTNLLIRAWLIFLLSSFFYCYQFLLQVSTDALSADLVQSFHVNEHRLGLLSAAFFLTYTLMQIPAGILLDRFGPHRLLTFACLACACGCLVFALAPHFYVASIARLIMGLGSAFVFIGSLKLISHWFPRKRFTLYTGFLVTIGMLGAIVGEAPFLALVAKLGWRTSMMTLGFVGFILTLGIWGLIQNQPTASILLKKQPVRSATKITVFFKKKQLWLVALYTGILSIPATILYSLYGIPLLMAKLSISAIIAAKMVSLILVGMAIGCPFWGWLSDYTQRRLPPMIMAAFFSPLLLALLVYGPITNLWLLGVLLACFGFFSSGSLPAFSIVSEIHSLEQTATALSIINTFDTLGATLALAFLGRLLVRFQEQTIQHGSHITTLKDYQMAFAFLLAIMLISLCLLPFIKETHAKCSL